MSAEIEPREELETKIDRLRVLSKKAEGGDREARAELRRAIARCSPEVIAEASNIARRAERMLVKTISWRDGCLWKSSRPSSRRNTSAT